jgi:hypothetical protein
VDDIQHDIDRVERRVRRYWVEDGLAEILSGLMIALVGLYLVIMGVMPARSPWSAAFSLGFPVFIVALGLLSRGWILAAKDRYVHPRTGFIQYRQRTSHRWFSGILAGCIAALFALLINRTPIIVTWIPALQGLLFGVMFFVGGRKLNVVRFSVEGVLAAVAGLVLSLQRLDGDRAAGLLFAWVGLVMAIGGAIVFRGYLRHTPPPEEA